MKQIVVHEDRWGQGWLQSRKTKKRCCLGFACLNAGLTEDDIKGVAMPRILDNGPGDYMEFTARGGRLPSFELIELAKKCGIYTDALVLDPIGYTTFGVLAEVNDKYHRRRGASKRAYRQVTIDAIRQGFKDMGYKLKFIPSKES